MKSRKVLLGLFVGVFVCFAGVVSAQKANYQSTKLVEIGPDNLGGRVTSLVVMGPYSSVFAGTAGGGLYELPAGQSASQVAWDYVPCMIGGKEVTLSISCMTRLNDSTLILGTGESYYPTTVRQTKFTPMGRGIYMFNANTHEFTSLASTAPQSLDDDFATVNTMDVMRANDGTIYLYVATAKGLFRWVVSQPADLMNAPVKVFDGNVFDLKISNQYNRAFFTSNGHLYKISDVVTGSNYVDITSSNAAFGANAGNIFLAMAPSDESYLYAMVTKKNGLLSGLYLTRNTNTWTLLSTSTVLPFNSNATAMTSGAITVSPNDPQLVYLGGAAIWRGKGYVADSPFQWSSSSYDENTLNYGDYMSNVYSSSLFVHSGIHQIVLDSRYPVEEDGNGSFTPEELTNYFIVTDGGIYYAAYGMSIFSNFNAGLNSVQINSLAVLPDGSIISGANSNGCPFIESRMGHNGGVSDTTWYDPVASTTNHKANILWYGNGGAVAASRFSQHSPISRRTLFVSGANGVIGRAYADYSNYTNTQTWTYGTSFMSDQIQGGPAIGQISLWETHDNLYPTDSMTFVIDTLAYATRSNGDRYQLRHAATVNAGDTITVLDVAHASYPFKHVFDHSFTVKNELRHKVKTPYASRMLAITVENDMPKNTNVSYCWFPTDFRQVYDESNDTRFWSHIYGINGQTYPHDFVRNAVMSNDGSTALIVVENDSLNQSYIVRVKGLATVDYSLDVPVIRNMLNYKIKTRVTTIDTILIADSSIYLPGRVSSMTVDPRNGQDNLLLTFDGTGNAYSTAYIENVTSDHPAVSYATILGTMGNASAPAYSALIECTTGRVFVGTEQGVYTAASAKNPTWEEYGAFNGVPVTAICQQTVAFPVVRYTGHDGVTDEEYIFPHTKWPYAIYFGTYGRGIFMDTTYVVDHENEILDSAAILGIPTVVSNGQNVVRCYPNPAVDRITMEISVAKAGRATLTVYDLSGKQVLSHTLGTVAEGMNARDIDVSSLTPGMYLINVTVGGDRATSKLIVR